MNILTGTIIDVQSNEGMSLVKVKTKEAIIFTSIVLDDVQSAPYLHEGKVVDILFKETEVIISTDMDSVISIQNRIPCVIHKLTLSVLLGQVDLLFGENRIKSIITANACKQLNLKENDNVLALIKTNEISLSPHG